MIERCSLASGQRCSANRLICAFLFLVAFGTAPLLAQTVPRAFQADPALQARSAEFSASIIDLAQRLDGNPRMRGLTPQRRKARVEFVVGNIHFVTAHELGHALISELNLPVLGREEDSADVYAILKSLGGGSEFSRRILIKASKAWFLSGRRGRREGEEPNYYERHSLDEQRAYHIICLMVGSDPGKFKALADEHKLPEDRRRSCGWDYDTTVQSWNRVLAPHLRELHQPKVHIDVVYGEATGALEVVARSFREIRYLERMAEFAAERYLWPAPIKLEMRSCGEGNARWTIPTRTLHICYELVDDFVELFRELERSRRSAERKTRR